MNTNIAAQKAPAGVPCSKLHQKYAVHSMASSALQASNSSKGCSKKWEVSSSPKIRAVKIGGEYETCSVLVTIRKHVLAGGVESVHAWQVTSRSGWRPKRYFALSFFVLSVVHASVSASPAPATPVPVLALSVAGFQVSGSPVLSVSRLPVFATSPALALAFVSHASLSAFFYAAALSKAFRLAAMGYRVLSPDARRLWRDQHIVEGYAREFSVRGLSHLEKWFLEQAFVKTFSPAALQLRDVLGCQPRGVSSIWIFDGIAPHLSSALSSNILA